MSNLTLEDEMLNSAYENFLQLTLKLEQKHSPLDSIYKVANEIELLKDILQEASMHLDCYRCHEKLLLQDQNTLINKQHSLIQEYNLYLENIKNPVAKITSSQLNQAKKDNEYLQEQVKKYLNLLKENQNEEKETLITLQEACDSGKRKDVEIKKLQSHLERLSSVRIDFKALSKSRSENKIIKDDIKPYPSSSFSIGLSQKNTTINSSRG